ncbi:hypothetical protein RND71_031905 [Anisodus tanguticus]|uniref:Uncharacterized protein n=1 Tax=Anisodus tanguticus TaxID=243964 RepID=A0AAE1V636_9SOLA|nr:hypothetical protein RND71_031905 [Anisodus tanguticus]
MIMPVVIFEDVPSPENQKVRKSGKFNALNEKEHLQIMGTQKYIQNQHHRCNDKRDYKFRKLTGFFIAKADLWQPRLVSPVIGNSHKANEFSCFHSLNIPLTNADWPIEKLKEVISGDALKYPNWNMGKRSLLILPLYLIRRVVYGGVNHPSNAPKINSRPGPDGRAAAARSPDNVKYPSMDLAYTIGQAGGTMIGAPSAAKEKALEKDNCEKLPQNSLSLLRCINHNVEHDLDCTCNQELAQIEQFIMVSDYMQCESRDFSAILQQKIEGFAVEI